jgi:molecular chaperone GrpE
MSSPDPTTPPEPASEPTETDSPAVNEAAGDMGSVEPDQPAVNVAAGDIGSVDTGSSAEELINELEADLGELDRVSRERDEYLDALRHLQADFENYKKRMLRQQSEHQERAAEVLIGKLLPVFDTADLAVAHGGGEEVQQLRTSLFDVLGREGLERIDAADAPFDPTVHEAVVHEPDGEDTGPKVDEVMRAGYRWKGRVLRPAMVKVKG